MTGCAAGASAVPGPATPAAPATPVVVTQPGAVPTVPGAAVPLGTRRPLVLPAPVTPRTPGGLPAPGFSTQYRYRRLTTQVPPCAHAGRAIALPRSFPASFPFPPGTAVTSQIGYRGDQTKPVISGVVPSASFGSAVQFFLTQLPQAGYRLRDGDAEAFEAESVFVGHGYIGRWRIRALDTCPSALVLFVFAEKYPLPAT